MSSPAKEPARRSLSHAESFKICTWYAEHKERLLLMTDTETIKEIETTLGITGLNESHMMGVRKTLGLQKRAPRKAAAESEIEALTALLHEQGGKLADLEAKNATLTANVQALLGRVRNLETHR